jgi:peptide/nickel transport system permease protein
VLDEDFIMFSKSKGIGEKAIIYRHALPNAFLPVLTSLAMSLGHLVGGATVIETVFSYPGLGNTIYSGVVSRDYPLIQGAFLIISLSVVAANFLVDLIYPMIDPRIRRHGEET